MSKPRMSEEGIVIAASIVQDLLEKPCTTKELMDKYGLNSSQLGDMMLNITCVEPVYNNLDGGIDSKNCRRHGATWYHLRGNYEQIKS